MITWREEDPCTRKILEGETTFRYSPCRAEEEKDPEGIKKAGDKNKNAIWALLLSLPELVTTFQRNYYNNQLKVTPKKMTGVYCRD